MIQFVAAPSASPDDAIVEYEEDPDRDEPMAFQEHSDTIDNLYYPLLGRVQSPTCYVARDLRVYPDHSDMNNYRAPDILVAFNVPYRVRHEYFIADEGKAPDLVIEILSRYTARKDLGEKLDWYHQAGVREYVILDPLGEFASQPRMQRYWFDNAKDPLARRRLLADPDGLLRSEIIPFAWLVHEGWVRLIDPATRQVFPMLRELEMQLRLDYIAQMNREAMLRSEAEQARAEAEAQQARAEALEREVQALRRQLEERR